MEVRVLDSNDAEQYRKIRLEGLQTNPDSFSSSYEEEKDYLLERYKGRLNGVESLTFGAFFQQELVGVVTLIFETKNKLKHRANIAAMYVNPHNRMRGIGKALMVAAINKAKTLEHIEQIYLGVIASNEPAKKLYQSLGFETYGIDKKAIKIDDTYFDDELMVLVV
ncbi:GNAT family N-acetyltransferase [Neobacillus sp. D3-1R]|uniref:GNAT family N-acetyltransferase n=1 Tax=Neobacillus sp. D3-1R TaxID=3445778 RepID=UPI003FA0FC20